MKNRSQLEDLKYGNFELVMKLGGVYHGPLGFLEEVPLGHIKTKMIEFGVFRIDQWIDFMCAVFSRMKQHNDISLFELNLLYPVPYIMLEYMRDVLVEFTDKMSGETFFIMMAQDLDKR